MLKITVRRTLSFFVRRVLRARSRPFPLASADITLILAPHQDDETLGCGGLIPLLLRAGRQVHISYVTDGGGSHSGISGLVDRRRAEAFAATALLGVPAGNLEFLGARDGFLPRLNASETAGLVAQLTATLRLVHPTLVLLPCRADGSSEHQAGFALFRRALAASALQPRVLEFPVWSWWNPLLLRQPLREASQVWRAAFPGHAGLKQRALAIYLTQLESQAPATGPMLTTAFLSFFTAAEEFFFEH